jgi:hypothetical protein
MEFGIVYPKFSSSNNKLVGYSDSDFGGDVDDRKSTTGVMFFMGEMTISWQSHKQTTVLILLVRREEDKEAVGPMWDLLWATGRGSHVNTNGSRGFFPTGQAELPRSGTGIPDRFNREPPKIG